MERVADFVNQEDADALARLFSKPESVDIDEDLLPHLDG